MQENSPDLWRHLLPEKVKETHKYDYGWVLIYGADELTGATRLAASACTRMGAGLVTVLANKEIANVYRVALPAHIMVRNDLQWFHHKVNVKIYGCGGLPIKPDYKSNITTILDADALKKLPNKLSPNYILTPHDGEFDKAFPELLGTRLERVLSAANNINAHIVLKGAETIIACPNGKYFINHHAPPTLATAGSGDVLAGMIGGLIAQKMPVFEACMATTWIHGECAYEFGKGLVAEDIVDMIPNVLNAL